MAAGAICGYVLLLVIDWFFKLIPIIMLIPRQVRGQDTSLALFMEKFSESFASPAVYNAGNLAVVGVLVAILAISVVLWRFRSHAGGEVIVLSAIATALLVASAFLLRLTILETELAISNARDAGESLPIWSQLVFISAGIALISGSVLHIPAGNQGT